MKSTVLLMFSCIFTLFLATAAQASNFSGNTCYEEGANCQTDEEWVAGWCEAAVAAGVFIGTAEQCVQPGGGGGRLAESTPSQNPAQNQNGQSGASSSRQSSGGGNSSGGNQAKDQTLTRSTDTSSSAQSGSGTPKQGSGKTGNQWEQCKSWRVHRDDPGRSVCVNPAPSGSLPKDYSEKENPSSGGGTPR